MKILFSSQDFAYGPTSQMFSFIKHLKIHWYENEIYIKKNSATEIFFNNFVNENFDNNVFLVNDFSGNYDVYIGFYDPDIIIEWKSKFKKTLFICNLTFLWNDSIFNDLKNENIDNLLSRKTTNHHHKIALWYYFADKVYIRNTDKTDLNSQLYKNISHKTQFIWPIIYPKIYNQWIKKHCVIQLWWQINPITPKSFYFVYLKLVSLICKNISWEKKLIIHPDILEIALKYFSNDKNYEIITTTWQWQYQKILSESYLLMSPFWINTFFESSYFNIPTYILPEQHLWHIKSLIQYVWDLEQIKNQSFLLYNIEKYNTTYENEIDFIDFLENQYENLIKTDSINLNFNNLNYPNIIKYLKIDTSINNDIDKIIKEIKT